MRRWIVGLLVVSFIAGMVLLPGAYASGGRHGSSGSELGVSVDTSYSDGVLSVGVLLVNDGEEDVTFEFKNSDYKFNVILASGGDIVYRYSDVLLQNGVDLEALKPEEVQIPAGSSYLVGSVDIPVTPGVYTLKVSVRITPQLSATYYVNIAEDGSVEVSDSPFAGVGGGAGTGSTTRTASGSMAGGWNVRHHAGVVSLVVSSDSLMLVGDRTATLSLALRNNGKDEVSVLPGDDFELQVRVYDRKTPVDAEVVSDVNLTQLELAPGEEKGIGEVRVVLPESSEPAEYLIKVELAGLVVDGRDYSVGVHVAMRYFPTRPGVSAPSWAEDYLQQAIDLGLIYIPADGQVVGDRPALRRDVIYAAAAILGISAVDVSQSPWSDVGLDDPMIGIFVALYEKGLLKGYPDGTLKPDKPVTRAEAITLFIRIIAPEKLNDTSIAYRGEFKDVKPGDWYAKVVEVAYRLGLVKGDGKGHFMPSKEITISELVVLAIRAYQMFSR